VRTYTVSSLALEIFLFAFWLFPLAVSSQMTPPALGRLHITSTPQGANITINDNPRPELTNVTLVVAPGQYRVAVSGGPGGLNCPGREFTVSAGRTVEVTCPTTR